MNSKGPVISRFTFHDEYLVIDWEKLKQVCIVSIPNGYITVRILPPPNTKYKTAVGIVLSADRVEGFVFRLSNDEESGEIFLIDLKGTEMSMGTTKEISLAQKWTSMANEVIAKIKAVG